MADILKDELVNDPLTRGYSAMTPEEAAANLNTKTRTRLRTSMTSSEVLNQVVVAEFNALTEANKRTIWDILHIGDINPTGVEATIFVNIFGAGSTTISNLSAARTESISRAQELGLGEVKPGHVEEVRR